MTITQRVLLALVLITMARRGLAQQPEFDLRRDQDAAPAMVTGLGSVSATPEMWFYEQERRNYEDPRMAVRRRAEARANERHERIASSKWYGIDASRPVVSHTPSCGGSYGAYWAGNSFDPFRWRPMAGPLVVIRPGMVTY